MPKIEGLKKYCNTIIENVIGSKVTAPLMAQITLAAIQDYEDANKLDENGLLPCGFCKSKADRPTLDPDYSYGNDLAPWKLVHRCTDKWRGKIEFHGATEFECIKAWNTRPQTKANAAIARIVEGEKA